VNITEVNVDMRGGLLTRILDAAARTPRRDGQLRRATRDLRTGAVECPAHFRTFIANSNKFIVSVTRVFHLNVKRTIKLTVNNLSFFIVTHDTFFTCKFKQVYRGNNSELSTCSYQFFSHSNRYYPLPKY